MARILGTGATDGIGLQTATQPLHLGHDGGLHARDDARAAAAGLPGVAAVVGDLASLAETKALAKDAGAFDVVVHNAGVGGQDERRVTGDGLELTFQVNTLAPYVLTALMPRPARLIYL